MGVFSYITNCSGVNLLNTGIKRGAIGTYTFLEIDFNFILRRLFLFYKL